MSTSSAGKLGLIPASATTLQPNTCSRQASPSRGCSTALILAKQTDGPVVVVEGPTDVWRFGPGAVAMFGKQPSGHQRDLLRRHFPGRPIVVLLDVDAQADARQIQQQLATARPGVIDRHVVIGQLPPGRDDPGDCTREELQAAIDQALEGVTT